MSFEHILLIAAFLGGYILLFSFFRTVPVRKALIICSRSTGKVRTIVVGPGHTAVIPFVHKAIEVDMTTQYGEYHFDYMNTCDNLAIVADLEVFFTLNPAKIDKNEIDKYLPFLLELEPIVGGWANFVLRSLVASWPAEEIRSNATIRARLDRLFLNTLLSCLKPFGVEINSIRLLFSPVSRVLDARLDAQAQTSLLAALRAMLGDEAGLEQLIPLELIHNSLKGNNNLFAHMDVGTLFPGSIVNRGYVFPVKEVGQNTP
jgi:hypothetical protein